MSVPIRKINNKNISQAMHFFTQEQNIYLQQIEISFVLRFSILHITESSYRFLKLLVFSGEFFKEFVPRVVVV